MDYWVETALRPLRHYADFRGRATRSELVAFYVLISALAYLTAMLAPVLGPWSERIASELVRFALLCPILALFVRRLHDQGRTGWWSLLLLPAAAAGAWQFYRSGFSLDPIAQLAQPLPTAVQAIVMLCILALLVLLMWKDETAANRHGPNPRYDEPAGPQSSHIARGNQLP